MITTITAGSLGFRFRSVYVHVSQQLLDNSPLTFRKQSRLLSLTHSQCQCKPPHVTLLTSAGRYHRRLVGDCYFPEHKLSTFPPERCDGICGGKHMNKFTSYVSAQTFQNQTAKDLSSCCTQACFLPASFGTCSSSFASPRCVNDGKEVSIPETS